jgi:FlaA1/EpsC-like NDP-sugar epimerase
MSPSFRNISLQRAARILDLAALSIAFVVAVAIGSGSFAWPDLAHVFLIRIKIVNIVLFGCYLAVCSAIFSTCGFYLSHRLSGRARHVREIFLATTLITGVILVVPLRMAFATEKFIIAFWILSFGIVFLTRVVGQYLLNYARSRGRNLRRIVIIGEGSDATALAHRIEQEPTLGYRVVRVIDAKENQI